MLLNNTFGWAQPNAMIALMGASGAGKSTLMDVLALKKNFKGQVISGTVLVNGVPQDPISFSRIAGYVEQVNPQHIQPALLPLQALTTTHSPASRHHRTSSQPHHCCCQHCHHSLHHHSRLFRHFIRSRRPAASLTDGFVCVYACLLLLFVQ